MKTINLTTSGGRLVVSAGRPITIRGRGTARSFEVSPGDVVYDHRGGAYVVHPDGLRRDGRRSRHRTGGDAASEHLRRQHPPECKCDPCLLRDARRAAGITQADLGRQLVEAGLCRGTTGARVRAFEAYRGHGAPTALERAMPAVRVWLREWARGVLLVATRGAK